MTYVEGATDGCTLSYLARLNEERRSFCDYNRLSPFVFTVLVDRKIRRMVSKLTDERSGVIIHLDPVGHAGGPDESQTSVH